MALVLVTGATRGIGLEVVRQLARAGHHALLGGRTARKSAAAAAHVAEALSGERHPATPAAVTPVVLDVTDPNGIEQAVRRLKDDFGKLDVLINNAAILLEEDRALSADQDDVLRKTMRTNLHGPVAVTRAVLPLMPAGGRVIMTSSGGGSMTDPIGGWAPAYCTSKAALNAATRHLAFELGSRNISVNAYCPGWTKTDMGGMSAPRTVEQAADTAVWLATAERIGTGSFYRDRMEIPW